MIVGDMEIRLRADIARLQRDMDDARRVVGNATAGMERAANAVKAAFAGIAAGLSAREIIQAADEYTKFTAQLKLATQSQREYAQAYASVKAIATASQQDLGATGMLYARIANGTRELGVSQKQVAEITNTVNMALKVSGATASESASAQLQLSQAFASGTLRGEEFNAVNEAAPRLMLALADGIGVPVGALKKMAEEGQITSKIMADVLPKALADLKDEAKEVQTIAGAFTVLKNNAMEFVGAQAQANGVVSAATGGLMLLAENLALVAGTVMTLGAAKFGSMVGEWVVATYKQVAAASALRAANVASAEAEVAATGAKLAQLSGAQAMIVVAREEAMAKLAGSNANITSARTAMAAAEAAGAQSFALRTLRLATAELSVAEAQRAAMVAELAILGRQQAAVSAQITAATAAQTAAQAGLNAATTAGIGAAGLASRALGLLGGPVGAIITILGLGATAWAMWGNSAKEANDKASLAVEETHDEVIARIQKQNEKLKERIALAAAQPKLKVENAAELDRLAKLWTEYNDAKNGTGQFRNATDEGRGVRERIALREYNALLKELTENDRLRSVQAQKGVDERVAAFKKEHATKQEQMNAELAAIADLKGKTAEYGEMEKRIRAKYADSGAANAFKQEATAYQNLITSIREKSAANQLELNGYSKLSDSQKMAIKLDAEISTGKTKLSADSIKLARAEIERLEVQEQALEFQQLAAKASEAQAKADADHYAGLRTGTAAIESRIEQMQREIDLHGLSASAAVDAERAKLEAKLAAGPATYAELAALDAQIEKLGELAKLTRNKEVLDANKKAAEQAADDWQRAADDINRSLTDALLRGFESGKSFGRNLVDTLKNMFQTLILRPTIQGIMAPMAGALVGGMPGVAQAAGGAAGSAMGGIAGGLGIGGAMASIGTGAMQTAGALLTGQIGLGTTLSAGLSAIGTGTASGIMAGMSSVVGALGPIALGIGAVATILQKGFSMGPREVTRTSLDGTFGAGGFSGNVNEVWKQEGGWFRSDKGGVTAKAVEAELVTALNSTYDALKTSTVDYAKVLGVQADYVLTRSQNLSVALTGDQAKDQQAITDFFGKIGNDIAVELVPALTSFTRAGETASATLQRLATGYAAIDQALWSVGMAFSTVGTASLEARERLLAAAGGLEAFAANTAGFQQNFLSEAERNAPVLKMVTEQMAALGLSAVDTREEFKQTVLGLDLTTEAGAKQYGALMKLQAAFAQVYPTTEAMAAALAEQEEAARRAAEATQQAAEAARQAAIQATKDRASALLSGVDSAFSALQSVVGREKALLQDVTGKHQALAQALRGTLDSMSVSGQEREDRLGAQAQIRTALAIAKASGVLPDADKLRGALSVLGKDSSSLFATQQDYLRDFYTTQNDIAALAGLTDDALSVEEQSLKALDGILESAQQQIDALKGVDMSVFSLAEAIRGWEGAIGAAKGDPVASAGGSIAGLYKELLGRPADSAGLDYWQNAVAGGMSLDEIRKMIMQGSEYQLRGFAVGTNFVPTNMPAMIHEGERIIPAADNRELMRRLSSPSENGAALAAAVDRLTAENAAMRKELNEALYAIAKNTLNTADHLDAAVNGDVPLATKVIPA